MTFEQSDMQTQQEINRSGDALTVAAEQKSSAARVLLGAAALLLVCLCTVAGLHLGAHSRAGSTQTTIAALTESANADAGFQLRLPAENAIPAAAEPSSRNAENAADDETNETVYVTAHGTRFHRDSCGYLRNSRIALSRVEATAKGYTACSRCSP